MAVCRAHSHAVPHTRLELDQHWQSSLRWVRRQLQNDDLNIGLCEPRLRSMRAEAMQAMQDAAKWQSAPQKPTSIMEEDHHSDQRLPCLHLDTTTTRGLPKEQKQATVVMVVVCEHPGRGITQRHHDVAWVANVKPIRPPTQSGSVQRIELPMTSDEEPREQQ